MDYAFDRSEILTVAEVLRILRRWAWVIVAVVVLAMGLGVGYTATQSPVYEASGLVVIEEALAQDASRDAQGIQFAVEGLKAITPTMARAVVSRPVVEAAVRQPGIDATPAAVSERLKAEPVADTLFIRISYQDASPQQAQRIVNAVSESSSRYISQLDPIATPIGASVWEPADVPSDPVRPGMLISVLAFATGLMLGVLSAFLLEGLSNAGVPGSRGRKQ